VDKENKLIEWNQEEGSSSSSNNQAKPTISKNSNLAFYWPNLVYQDDYQDGTGEISLWTYNELGDSGATWKIAANIEDVGSDVSGLAIIPEAANHSSHSVFFQNKDGKLKEYRSSEKLSWGSWAPPDGALPNT